MERVGQPGGCWLPWEHHVWGRVHPVIISGAEVGGCLPATFWVPYPVHPSSSSFMLVVLGGSASSQEGV